MNTGEMKSIIIAMARFSRVPLRGKDNRLGVHVLTVNGYPVAVAKGTTPRDPGHDQCDYYQGIITYYPCSARSSAEVALDLALAVARYLDRRAWNAMTHGRARA